MLKETTITLTGKDTNKLIRLREGAALVTDRLARQVLTRLGEPLTGGIFAVALQHIEKIKALGAECNDLLNAFVQAELMLDSGPRRLDMQRDLNDWRSVSTLQQTALYLHVGFLLTRQSVDLPVAFRAASADKSENHIKWCSPFISSVLDANLATYHEMETSLSTEDVINLLDIVNIRALRDWSAHNQSKRHDRH